MISSGNKGSKGWRAKDVDVDRYRYCLEDTDLERLGRDTDQHALDFCARPPKSRSHPFVLVVALARAPLDLNRDLNMPLPEIVVFMLKMTSRIQDGIAHSAAR